MTHPSMASVKKRPRDSYDQTDLQSHTVRLNERVVKYQLHNYGSAMDVFDAVARTLMPYWEYNERYKIRVFQQLQIDPTNIANLAHHVRAQLQALHNEETSANVTIHGIDVSSGASSVYLESSPHGRTLQLLTNLLDIEIRLVTSYIYEEVISVVPNDRLETDPLYIAFNDVSKQFFMLDRPTNVKRDDLLQHQQTIDQWVQTYSLVPMPISKPNPRCLSLFQSIAQVFKANAADFLDTSALATQIRDATHQQIQSNIDLYEKYCPTSSTDRTKTFDLRRDSQALMEWNYYRYQLERPVLFALAHVLQCTLVLFSSGSTTQTPDFINYDKNASNRPEHIIVLLKNESTQRFTSARTSYPLHHLFLDDEPENQLDPVYETIDHSPVMDSKNKAPSTNTFFSKTKDKLVTAVNKLVDNYGNVPKKQISQPRPNNNSSKEPYPSNEPKISTTKRQAPLAEHVLRRHEQTPEHATRSANDVTYENTQQMLSTPGATRRSSTSSSSNVTTAKNSQISSSSGAPTSKHQLRPVPYKDRQKTFNRMTTGKATGHQNVFNGVTVEDVDESTTAEEGNNNDDDDSFSDEANDHLQSVILRERKKKTAATTTKTTTTTTTQRPSIDQKESKSTAYHYDRDALKRQQQTHPVADEDLYENDRQRDEFNHDDDIYLSTSDIVQRDRKQLQLFVNDRTNQKQSSSSLNQSQERKQATSKLTSSLTSASATGNDRQSFLIDKDAVLEVLGHNIAQRDRHILMKVLKQEDLVSKEWQRLLFLLDEYVNNPKKEKKERGLHALTLMENLDRLGYDMLEIQSTEHNHFKAVAKSILLIIEINDWFSEHICRVLHLNGPNDSRLVRHLRKLCLREWARYPDDYRALFVQRQAIQQQQRTSLDITREIERFRAEDYYRSDMCALVNQGLATALAIPIHIVRAVREPNNPLEIYMPMRGIARPGLAVVLIASHPNASDGHYDVAVLKGHPQTLRKHRNVTFDDKPEVRSFETNVEEQQAQPTLKVPSQSNTPTVQQQQQQPQPQMINPALMAAHQAQFFPNPFMYSPYTFTTIPQQQQQQQQQQQPQQQPLTPQAPSSPSLVRPPVNALNSTNAPPKTNIGGVNNTAVVPPPTMMIQPQMPFMQMGQGQPTFVYTPLMHPTQPTTNPNPAATFFYTPANYPM